MTLPTREEARASIRDEGHTSEEWVDIMRPMFMAYADGVLMTREEWAATTDRLAIRDTLIENDGLSYDTITDRITALFAAAMRETDDDD